MYDSGRGAFSDLSVLDVLQIFGRAGRPGLESSGEGYICTTEESLSHYLDAVTTQVRVVSFTFWFLTSMCIHIADAYRI